MNLSKLVGTAAIISIGALFASVAPAQATMFPAAIYVPPVVQHVDCAAGFRLGPVGACILGTDDHRPDVVERRDDNGGCETKSVTKQDAAGNTETKTKTNC